MRARPPLLWFLAVTLLTAVTRDVSAQVRTIAPIAPIAPIRTLVPVSSLPPSPGTGTIAVSISIGSAAAVSLGNATGAQFADHAIPTPSAATTPKSGTSTTASQVSVIFAPNDQLVTNTSRVKTCSGGITAAFCQLTLTVLGTTGQPIATYVLKSPTITATSTTSPTVVTFAYRQIQYTFPPAPAAPPPPPITTTPGTGPLAVAVRSATGSAFPLGNGTALQFVNLDIPTPTATSATSGTSTTAGDVIVTFAAGDNEVANITRGNPCPAAVLGMGCALTIAVAGSSGQVLVTYVMTGVTVNSMSSGSPQQISFNYKQAQYTFPPPPPLTPGSGSIGVGLTMVPGGVVGLGNATAVKFTTSGVPTLPVPTGPTPASGVSNTTGAATITFGTGNQFVSNNGSKVTGCSAVLSLCQLTLTGPANTLTYVLKGVKPTSSSPSASAAVMAFSYTQVQYTFAAPPPPPPPPPTPGTGQVTVSLVVGSNRLALGTGTLAQFTDPAIPNLTLPQAPGASAPPNGQSSTAGSVVVFFAGNNTLAASVFKTTNNWQQCNAVIATPTLCHLTVTVVGTGGQPTATYQLTTVRVTGTALTDSPPSASFSYNQIQYTF